MKNTLTILLVLTLFIHSTLFSEPLIANSEHHKTIHYRILSEDDVIGEVTIKLLRQGRQVFMFETSHIDVSGWWGSINIKSNSMEEYLDGINLVRMDSKILDNDENEAYWIELSSKEKTINGKLTVITDVNDPQKLMLDKLANRVKKTTKLTGKEYLSSTQPIFKGVVQKHKKESDFSFSNKDIDTSVNALPFYIAKKGLAHTSQWLNLIDLEDFEIKKTRVDNMGMEVLTINGRNITARHLKLSIEDNDSEPQHIWIADEKSPLPYMVRYTSVDELGPSEVVIKL